VQLQIDASSTAVAADWTQGGATFGSFAPGSAGTIVIPAGDTFVQFSLTPSADLHAEVAETVRINVTADAAYTLGSTANATVTIGQNDFLVINTNNAGEGTLRQAVLNANALAGADTIIFSDGSGSSVDFTDATADTITLSGGELTLASDVTIAGAGANLLILQNTQAASATSRVFNIASGLVRLTGLTITGGNSTSNGCGIQIAARPMSRSSAAP
jgi:hypothetical protein